MRHSRASHDLQYLLADRQDFIRQYHKYELEATQCGSILIQLINASLKDVWSIVSSFDRPQVYKKFIQSCSIIKGDGKVGTVREVRLISGIPATSSVERLELLDEEQHIFSFRVLGGGHRLHNYCSVTSLHEHEINGRSGTLVLESYYVDVPEGNTKEETQLFADTLVKCNLKSLCQVAEHLVLQGDTQRLSLAENSAVFGLRQRETQGPTAMETSGSNSMPEDQVVTAEAPEVDNMAQEEDSECMDVRQEDSIPIEQGSSQDIALEHVIPEEMDSSQEAGLSASEDRIKLGMEPQHGNTDAPTRVQE